MIHLEEVIIVGLICGYVLRELLQIAIFVYYHSHLHLTTFLEIKVKCNVRGKGYWKLNNSILDEEDYKEGISKIFNDAVETYEEDVSKSLLWEFLKIKFKEFSIMYCTLKSRTNKQTIKDLEAKLDVIDSSNESQNPDQYIDRKNTKQQLDHLYETKAKGYHVRSRAKWVEHGERSTSYFLGLEKARQSANCIDCLKDNDISQNIMMILAYLKWPDLSIKTCYK